MKVTVSLYRKERLEEMDAPNPIIKMAQSGKEFEADYDASNNLTYKGIDIPTKYCEYVRVKRIKEWEQNSRSFLFC